MTAPLNFLELICDGLELVLGNIGDLLKLVEGGK